MSSFLRLQKFCWNPQFSIYRLTLPSCTSIKSIHSTVVSKTSLLRSSGQSLNFSRTFWETFPLAVRSVHAKDGLHPDNYELVYHSRTFNYVFYAQFFTQVALSVQLIGSSYYAYQAYVYQVVPSMSQIGPFSITYDALTLFVLTFFTMQNILALKVAQCSLLRIYHKVDTDEYVLVSLSLNPFKSHLMPLKAGNLKPLYIRNLLACFGNYKCNRKKFFIKHGHFKNVWHYNQLVGSVDKESFY